MDILEHVSLRLCAILGHFLISRNWLTHQQLLILSEYQSDAESCWENLAPKMLFGSLWSRCWFGLRAPSLPSDSLYVFLVCWFSFSAVACSTYCSFLKDPTPHLLPLFPADYLIFLRKMRSSDESSLNASLPNFSAFLPRTVSMFCESPVLCEMNGGTHFLKSFSDPKLELCLNKSNTTFKIIDSHTLLLYSTLSSEDIKWKKKMLILFVTAIVKPFMGFNIKFILWWHF